MTEKALQKMTLPDRSRKMMSSFRGRRGFSWRNPESICYSAKAKWIAGSRAMELRGPRNDE